MSKVIAGFTMSLDGYISAPDGSLEALYPDLADLPESEPLRESIQNTGAVVLGRKAYAMAEDPDWFAGNYEYQVPMFVLTHQAPQKHPKETSVLTFTFVTDGIESAVRQARAAAGKKDVTIVGGASITQQCINAGLVDELHMDIMPVFLFSGLRPFENITFRTIRLERLKVVELPAGRTHLSFRVVK